MDMMMEPRSNFYYTCYTYNYTAKCCYKFTCFLDFLGFLGCVLLGISGILSGSVIGWVIAIIALGIGYIGFRSTQLWCALENNMANGSLKQVTEDHLKIRVWYIAAILLIGVIQLIYYLVVMVFMKRDALGNSVSEVQWGAFIMQILSTCISILFAAWGQATLQKTLQEAADVLSGAKSAIVNAQVI